MSDGYWHYNYNHFAYDIFYILGYIWKIEGCKMKHIYKLLGLHGFTYYKVNKRWVLISNPAEQKGCKMSDMKCPFCQQELEIGGVDGILRGCPKCRNLGTEMLWQELIRTHKALKLAKDTLCWYDDNYDSVVARNTLDEIKTALEQMDFENKCEKYALSFQRDTDTPTMTKFRQESTKQFAFSLIQEFYERALGRLEDTKKKLDLAVSQLERTRDYIEGCRYQETNYFLVDSKDVSIIFDETNEALEQIKDKEQQ